MLPRRRLFRWLPIYNLTVIALTLAYQAPLHELTFGKWTAADKVRSASSLCMCRGVDYAKMDSAAAPVLPHACRSQPGAERRCLPNSSMLTEVERSWIKAADVFPRSCATGRTSWDCTS